MRRRILQTGGFDRRIRGRTRQVAQRVDAIRVPRSYRLAVAELEAFGITTADLAASLRFYGLLGLEVPDAGEGHVEADVPGRLRLMWDTEEVIRQIEPDLPSPVRQRVVLAFRCADPADVDATYRRIIDAGFEGKREPWDAFWGERFAYLRDPDGNTVALFAPLEQPTP